jgi:hypothetical protein
MMETVQEHFARLTEEIENVLPALLFNSDDSGFQEFVDSHEMCVIVPATEPHDSIEIPANKSVKWSAMLAAVNADSLYLKPIITLQRKTHEADPFQAGFRPANLLIVDCERGFIDRSLFQLWAEKVLFPEIERRRVKYNYKVDAAAILDECISHDSPGFLTKPSRGA